MKKLAILILFAMQFAWGAENPLISRFYQLKYADPQALIKLIQPLLASQAGSHSEFDKQLRAISIKAHEDSFPEIEQVISRFDVPPPPPPPVLNVEVTIYLMSALGTPSSGPVPPELEPVVKQLRSTFSYKGYHLIDTEVMRVRAGQGGEVTGVVNGVPSVDGAKTISQVKFRSASVSTDEKGRAIRIDGLRVGLRIPVAAGEKKYNYVDTGLNTDVDIREGQKVVVGKANMDGSDRASIVILTAKVVE
jgi:hypothetical protein